MNTTGSLPTAGSKIARIALALVTLAALLWAYWATLSDVAERWYIDPQYSHGFIVPFFSLYLLWRRRGDLLASDFQPRWWGVGVVLLGAAMRMLSHFLYQPWLDTASLLVCLAGVAATFGGRRGLLWSGVAILYLSFMLPLPYRLQTALGGSLQRIATGISTYSLQTVGVPAVSEGNVILLTNTKLGVVEACNGLSMMITFFALSTAAAILTRPSLIEKVVIVLSALPISVVANVARITITGVLFEASQDKWARNAFHDCAGLIMMPLAILLIILEVFILQRSVEPVQRLTSAYPGTVTPLAV